MYDGWLLASMQNIDMGGLARLVICPVCTVTDGTQSKLRPGRIVGLSD